MRIEVEKQINNETREVWSFNTFDLNAVFVGWHREVKPKGKRKWTIEKYWDRYARRDFNMATEPEIPEIIRDEALTKLTQLLRVFTWQEWKSL